MDQNGKPADLGMRGFYQRLQDTGAVEPDVHAMTKMDLIRRKILATGVAAAAMTAVRRVFGQQTGKEVGVMSLHEVVRDGQL